MSGVVGFNAETLVVDGLSGVGTSCNRDPVQFVLTQTPYRWAIDGHHLTLTSNERTVEFESAEQAPPAPAVTTTPSTTPTSTPSVPSNALLPDGTVAATNDGRVVELAPDGSILRTIVTTEGLIDKLQVVGSDIWFHTAESDDSSCGVVVRFSRTSGNADSIVQRAATFAVSADGTRLAYSIYDGCGTAEDGSEPQAAVIRDLSSGAERRWTTPTESEDFFAVSSAAYELEWSPDGTQLAVEWCYEGCGTGLYDPNVDGTFSYSQTVAGGEAPIFVDGDLWTLESFYGERSFKEEPLRINRYDRAGGELTSQNGPWVWTERDEYANPGPSELIVAGDVVIARFSYFDDPVRFQRWDVPGVVTPVTVDPSIIRIAGGS
jgi:hypothetical protein